MSTGNQEYIRDMNRALVLEAIANHPPLSRADLAKMLHLTKATVSTIVQELLDRQLVIELGSAEKTSMGRKPILLTFNNRCGSIIAVDLGVKKITILTGDLKGKSCTVKEYPIDPSLSLEEYLISLLHKPNPTSTRLRAASSESPSESTASSATTSFYSHPTTI